MTDSGPRAIVVGVAVRILHVPLNEVCLHRAEGVALWEARFTVPTKWFRDDGDGPERASAAFRALCALENAPVRFGLEHATSGTVSDVHYSNTLETVVITVLVKAKNHPETLWAADIVVDSERWRCLEVILHEAMPTSSPSPQPPSDDAADRFGASFFADAALPGGILATETIGGRGVPPHVVDQIDRESMAGLSESPQKPPPPRPDPEYLTDSESPPQRREFIMNVQQSICPARWLMRRCLWRAMDARAEATERGRAIWEVDLVCDCCGASLQVRALYPREVAIICGRRISASAARSLGIKVRRSRIRRVAGAPAAAIRRVGGPVWQFAGVALSVMWRGALTVAIVGGLLLGGHKGCGVVNKSMRTSNCAYALEYGEVTAAEIVGRTLFVTVNGEQLRCNASSAKYGDPAVVGSRGYRCSHLHWHALAAQGEDGNR